MIQIGCVDNIVRITGLSVKKARLTLSYENCYKILKNTAFS